MNQSSPSTSQSRDVWQLVFFSSPDPGKDAAYNCPRNELTTQLVVQPRIPEGSPEKKPIPVRTHFVVVLYLESTLNSKKFQAFFAVCYTT